MRYSELIAVRLEPEIAEALAHIADVRNAARAEGGRKVGTSDLIREALDAWLVAQPEIEQCHQQS